MPNKIGEDILKKSKRLLPSEVELTLKLPSPLDVISLRAKWEKEENRKFSDDEFENKLRKYVKEREIALRGQIHRKHQRKTSYPKEVSYI